MKKIFKSRMIMWVSILALLVVAVGGTLALMFTRANPLTNIFTVGAVDTEIKEDLTAGKQVSITNYGTAPAYVRARILVSGVDPDHVEITTTSGLPETLDATKVYLVMDNPTAWQQSGSSGPDGYYYYCGILQPKPDAGDLYSTPNLLEKVILGNELADDEQFLANFNVTIYHESVQAIGNGTNLDDVVTAFTNAGAGITEEAGSGADGSTT